MFCSASIILPIRVVNQVFDVYLENLYFCLSSLTSLQTIGIDKECIVVDLGSLPKYSAVIKKAVEDNAFIYAYKDSPMWSRSRAMNVGILRATKERVFFIDADTVLPVEYLLEHQKYAADDNYTMNLVYDSAIMDKNKKSSDVNILKQFSGKIRPGGWSHFSVNRSWLVKNGGYNEEYVGWGGEDNDIILRMKVSGLSYKILDCNPVHLYHPEYKDLMEKIGNGPWYKKQLKENRKRYFSLEEKLLGKRKK